jgi:CRISPR-associated protein Cas2
MAMTVVITRNVAARYRGFLASCMLEIAPGVYTAPRLNTGVRERIWAVCEEWFDTLGDGSVVMTWRDGRRPGGQGVLTLGVPPKDLWDHEGFLLSRGTLPKDMREGE